jgi:hypothetical protein
MKEYLEDRVARWVKHVKYQNSKYFDQISSRREFHDVGMGANPTYLFEQNDRAST